MSPMPRQPPYGDKPSRTIEVGPSPEDAQSGCSSPSELDSEQTIRYRRICESLIPNQGTFKRYIQELCSGSNTNLITEISIKRGLTNESYKKMFDDLVRRLKS